MTVYVVTGVCCDMDVVFAYLNKQSAEEHAKQLFYGEVTECPIEDYEES